MREIDNNNAAIRLSPLLTKGQYLPFTTSSLDFHSLAIILNDIVINNRKTILEFGSGASTVLMARLLNANGYKDKKIISIEHDKEWSKTVTNLLDYEGVGQYVKLINAPLVKCNLSLMGNKWYDLNVLKENIPIEIDTCIIDGPPAWFDQIKFARYPALGFVSEYLRDNSIVFIDDANRDGEKKMIESCKNIPFKKVYFSSSFVGLVRGNFFNISI